MRIHRISLSDFRGLETLDVEFDPTGVTIVEGRNEIGKTSIADAFMLLLDYKDSSAKKEIKDVQPIGRDVGPFVEAELTLGAHHLVYRKQWLKGKKTELDIAKPQREQLTGETAHNRMLEILANETDPDLFRALRYQQGTAISQAAVGQAPSLIAALDAAAGGTGVTGQTGNDVLLERVEKERLRYFTDKGAIPAARQSKTTRLEELQADVTETEHRIRKLDETADRQRRLESDLLELRAQLPHVEAELNKSRTTVQGIEEIERQVREIRHEHERAETALREAIAAQDARARLVAAAESAAETLSELERDIAAAAPALDAAKSAAVEAQQARDAARTACASTEQEAANVRRVVDLLDLRLERDQLEERHERVVNAEETIQAAEKFLGGCKVDDARLREIDETADRLAVAKGRADAGKPRLVVELLQPVQVAVDGEIRDALPGVPLEAIVSTEVEVVIGDVARITVSRPESARDVDAELAQAATQLEELLRASGVVSPPEAREVARERAQQETERDNARRRRADALRDLDLPTLAAKLGRANDRLGALEAEYDPEAAGIEKLEDARRIANEADGRVNEARSLETGLQTALEAAESSLRVLEDKEIEQRTRLDGARTEAERSHLELATDRLGSSDGEVQQLVAKATSRLDNAVSALDVAEKELAAGDPETARAMLENAEKLQVRLREDIHARELESAATRAHLEIEGQAGLADRLAETRARLEVLQREVNAENRRAVAVEYLHKILSEKREHAQQVYVGPYREKVNAYARILYGPAVKVEIDHRSFEIMSRTLNGTTVPFASLSGGAREQLCVLARLACGALVSPATDQGHPGGVPVIIDDALGYSDPNRLEKLGAAITVAGRDCQVIVLTCEPNRYRTVGGATVVPLG